MKIDITKELSEKMLKKAFAEIELFNLGKSRIMEKTTESVNVLTDELSKISIGKSDKGILTKKEKDILDDIFFGIGIDSFNRFPIFTKVQHKLSGAQYWYALGLVYTSSDNLYDYRKEVRKAFSHKQSGRQFLMNGWERRALANLPNEITIYRAMTKQEASGNAFGVSWTLSKKVAKFFRDDYLRNQSTNHMEKVIKEKIVKKDRIIAIFNGRKEKEVIYINPLFKTQNDSKDDNYLNR